MAPQLLNVMQMIEKQNREPVPNKRQILFVYSENNYSVEVQRGGNKSLSRGRVRDPLSRRQLLSPRPAADGSWCVRPEKGVGGAHIPTHSYFTRLHNSFERSLHLSGSLVCLSEPRHLLGLLSTGLEL